MLGKKLDFGLTDEITGEPRVKIANLNEIQQFVGNLVPDSRYIYLHVIAMGAGEFYGCNKNGDYFPERSLKMYHHTFQENAKVFKEHKNKPSDPSYGFVPKSWYNPEMHRVELVLAVDKEKDPETVIRIERGELPEVSMGCRVPHDVCSICGTKASKKSDYCSHINNELKKVYPDGRQVYMLNLQPTFFDISFVRKRADKIAFTLKKVASDIASTDHVYDIDDKLASIEKDVPTEAVVRLLNRGLEKEMPRLESLEKDLPVPMLDRLASRHSLKDILYSFLANMVPIKPAEVTRIIIVQNGLPISSFSQVLNGVMSAKPGVFSRGEVQPEISDLLQPFLRNRSSFGPYVMERLLQKEAAQINQSALNDILLSSPQYRYLYPDAEYYNPVHQTRVPVKEQPYASMPVMYAPEEYSAKMRNRKTLREPMSPWTVGLIMASTYAAYRSKQAIGELSNFIRSPKGMAAIGIGAAAIIAASRSGNSSEKTAGKVMSHFVLPFVGAHLLSAHYKRKYYSGQELGPIEQTIAENPDYLSIAAPVAMYYLGNKYNKKEKVAYELDREKIKLANASDLLINSAIQGIIFRGRGLSALNSSADMMLDNYALEQITNHLVNEKENSTETQNPGIIVNKTHPYSYQNKPL